MTPITTIVDNHLHVQPHGLGVAAAKLFSKFGGTHMIVSHMPYSFEPITATKSYDKQFSITLRLVEEINRKTNVKAYATLAPYPGDIVSLTKAFGLSVAISIIKEGLETAAELFMDGKCIAIGEFGRPHFYVEKELWNASNALMLYCFELAKEINAPVVLHMESGNHVYEEAAKIAKIAGLSPHKLVRHYATPIPLEKTYGITPSILAKRGAIECALCMGTQFLIESDYIDEPKKPGAVLGPATVPKRTVQLLAKGAMSVEQAYAIHHDVPTRMYGDYFEV